MVRMFPSATDECIRCYRLRDLLSLVGGYVFVGTVIIYPTILPPCFLGGDFSLRLTLSRGQPRANTARSTGRKQKRPVLLHTGYGEKHQKANGTCSLKKVISVPFMYKKYESKDLVNARAKRIENGTYSIACGTYNHILFV